MREFMSDGKAATSRGGVNGTDYRESTIRWAQFSREWYFLVSYPGHVKPFGQGIKLKARMRYITNRFAGNDLHSVLDGAWLPGQ
jgi:hypothetical protein